MAVFPENIIEDRDLDLFFQVQGVPVHIATYGCPIPNALNDIGIQAALLEKITDEKPLEGNDVQINQEFIQTNVIGAGYNVYDTDLHSLVEAIKMEDEEGVPQRYPVEIRLFCNSFYRFAERGFYSFDYFPERHSFYLVAWPIKTRQTSDLPTLELNAKIDFSKPVELTQINFA